MNESFFQPRGLYAMIMEYKPNSNSATEIVDLDTQVTMSAAKGGDTGSKFKVSSAMSHGEFQMHEAAPLVFPNLKGASAGQKQNASKNFPGF